jgi:hypothetical protein
MKSIPDAIARSHQSQYHGNYKPFRQCPLVPPSPPLKKMPFKQRRDREFLYLHEIDAVIAALAQTRAATRDTAIATLHLQHFHHCLISPFNIFFIQLLGNGFATIVPNHVGVAA